MDWKEVIGKTIKSVDEKFGANVVKLKFTDGSSVVIDTEAIGLGLYCPSLEPVEAYKPKKLAAYKPKRIVNRKIVDSLDDKVTSSVKGKK
jgi:hypothetical protein